MENTSSIKLLRVLNNIWVKTTSIFINLTWKNINSLNAKVAIDWFLYGGNFDFP